MTFEERIKSLSAWRFAFFFTGLIFFADGGAAVAFAAFYWDLI